MLITVPADGDDEWSLYPILYGEMALNMLVCFVLIIKKPLCWFSGYSNGHQLTLCSLGMHYCVSKQGNNWFRK